MASSIAKVSSAALSELQSDLTRLSSTLHKIYELMNADMRQVNVAWQDAKYQEFVQNYQPQIQKCEDIANRYSEWCKRVLDPTIENVTAVETADVGSGSSSSGVSAGVVGGAAAATAVGGTAIAGEFFMEIGNAPKPTTKAVPISNGCGPESSRGATFAANWIGRPVDAILTGTSIKAQNAACDRHDIDQFNGSPTADADFRRNKKFMGAMVEGDVKGAGDAFGEAATKVCEKLGGEDCDKVGEIASSKFMGAYKLGEKAGLLPSEEEIKEINKQSQLAAQKDREIHEKLKPIWEQEHQQSLDTEHYRVDVAEGGYSKL